MNILMVNYEYPPLGGGGGVINALLAEELAKRHEVTILTSGAPGLDSEDEQNGVKIKRVQVYFRKQRAVANFSSMLAFIPAGIRAGRRLMECNRFDLINTHFVLPTGPVGDNLSRYKGVPNVLSLHGGDLYDPSKWTSPHRHRLLRTWIKRLLRRSHRVVGQSNNTLENMRRFYAPEIDAVRIPLAIKRPTFANALSRRVYGFAENEVLLVTIGRLIARKANSQLIAMMDELREANVRLLILGSGPEEDLLKAETKRRSLEKRVLFLGHVNETEKFGILRMSNIYVSTSQHEGFGLVYLEAMACGLPIVCYNHGGQADFLRNEENGYLISLNDLDLFRQRCEMLIQAPDLRSRIGNTNRRRVEDYYIERCAASYEIIFQEVLGLNRQTRQ
jgi:glycosyltransferase involved in cell wall biosynthesis